MLLVFDEYIYLSAILRYNTPPEHFHHILCLLYYISATAEVMFKI